jgi:hypothetical protein
MQALTIHSSTDGKWGLGFEVIEADTIPVIREAKHNPSGYFWRGVAEILVQGEVRSLEGNIQYDPDGQGFYAYSPDRAALTTLANHLTRLASQPKAMTELILLAKNMGYVFSD